MGTQPDVMLLAVPLALMAMAGLLMLASHLEQQRTQVLVRMVVRSKSSTPEVSEAVIARELASVLAANGLGRSADAA